MAITLSETAARRIRDQMTGHKAGLRFGVRKSGCSGFAYVLDLAETAADDDLVFESQGVKVFVDQNSLGMVDGTRIDFVTEGLGETFKFENPNVAASCGCGESFTVV